MRKYVLTSLVLFPVLLSFSHAAQTWSVDPSEHAMVFPSESDDSNTSSYLGVDIADVTGDRVSALKLREEKGVEITMVDQDAPAGKAGLKEHDVIQTMNGEQVESAAQLRRMIHETPPGRVVTFGVSRDGQTMTIKVQLGDKRKEYALMAPKAKEFHFEMPEMPPMPEIDIPSFNMVVVTSSPRSGLTVENITPQLGEFFGVKNGTGVLVRAVTKGSRADKAGFRAGDIIVKINDQAVHDTSDFSHAVRSRNGNSVNIGVVRDRKEQSISLPLPEHKESSEMTDEADLDVASADAKYAVDLDDLNDAREEIARLRPEMELATESARKIAEEARKSACEYSKEARQEAEKERKEALREADQERTEALHEADQQKREALQEAREQRDELRKEGQKLRDEMRKMQRNLRKAWAEL